MEKKVKEMAKIPYQCRPLRGGVGTHRLPKLKLREARNRLDSLFAATDIGKFSSLKAVLRVSI